MDTAWPWIWLVLLGAFHGVNPAMGWLFAVALGLQERRLGAVIQALGPIALGHAASIGLVAITFGIAQLVVPQAYLLLAGGVILLAFAAYKVASRFRHPRWVGMRVRLHELVAWSFVMATAHGAGLMLVPVLARMQGDASPPALAAVTHGSHAISAGQTLGPALVAVALHTAAMLVSMGVLAVLVYQVLGVEVLRRAWINLDIIWVGALAAAGIVTLTLGLAAL